MITINKSRETDKQTIINDYLSWKKERDEIEENTYSSLLKYPVIKEAEDFVKMAHEGQFNKVDKLPFVNHPIGVAKIISSYTLNNDLIIAGLAHDVIEDVEGGREMVKKELGDNVLELVLGVTEIDKENSWEDRKKAYIDHLGVASTDVLVVSLGDHIHNLHRILAEYIELREKLWDYFGAKKERKIKYFYDYADKLASLLDKHNSGEFSKEFVKMFSDFVIILEFFGEITREEIDLNIEFDYDAFVREYNKVALENGGTFYELDENTDYLIYDYKVGGHKTEKEFAIVNYKNDQEY